MIRPTTLAMFVLAAGAGGLLFQVSFEVSALEDRLSALNRGIVNDQEAIHVLRAEWSYLNQPEKLEEMVVRHLDLAPLETTQIQSLASLPMRAEPEIGMDAEILLAEAKGLPRLKPVAPQRQARPNRERVQPREVKAIFVAQPAAAVRPIAPAAPKQAVVRTLGDVLDDVMKPRAE